MSGIRGKRNPMPKKGMAPTGIFSTRGSQKKDPTGPMANLTGNNADKARKDPVKRDNRIKK